MKIERTENELVIRLQVPPGPLNIETLLASLRALEALSHAQGSEAEAKRIADDISRDWWERNKQRFLK